MGNNIYETPRNQAKWHTSKSSKADKPFVSGNNEKQDKLEALKKRLEKNKK